MCTVISAVFLYRSAYQLVLLDMKCYPNQNNRIHDLIVMYHLYLTYCCVEVN